MELRHLRVFLVLVEELHFGRAAARLHVAQSAVSQTLKTLESEVGARLIARTKRKVALTPAGEQFAEHARRAIATLEAGAAASRRTAAGETGRLLLRFNLMSALTVLPRAIARFRREYPGVELRIEPGGTKQQMQALALGQCDIGFVVLSMGDPGPYQTEVISDEPLMTLLPSGHPLARHRSLRPQQLANEDMIVLSRKSEPAQAELFERTCRTFGFTPKIAFEYEQIDTVLAFVEAGLGVAFAPASVCKLRMRGVVAVPLSPRIASGVSAIWDPTRLPRAGQRFLDFVRQERDAKN